MDKFIVSARKYRPQNFNTVVGQSHITTTLKNAIKNNQLAHAFLFCGPRGVGKTTCARILAKTINCENQTAEGEACNTCPSCVSFDNGTSLNIHELDAASNNSVDDIRTLVDQVRFAPQAGRYKVYIVDEVHMLSAAAFNAFLKTLEEPPPYAIFILATTEKHKILPTILSRCQIFDFKRITNQDTVDHLQEICDKEHIHADKAALHIIAQKSEGCLRDALSILDKIVSFTNGQVSYANAVEHLNILDEDYYFRLIEAMHQQQVSDALLFYDEINRKGFEGDQVLNGFSEFIRNLLVSKDPKVAGLLEVPEEFRQRYLDAASRLDASLLLSALNILNEAEMNYRQARNRKLHVELTLIKLCYLQQALELVDEGGTAVKKKHLEGVKPVAYRKLAPARRVAAPKKEPPESSRETPAPGPGTPAKLVIREAAAGTPQPDPATPSAGPGHAVGKKVASLKLEKIHEQVAREHRLNADAGKPMNEEELYIAWGHYIEQLKNRNHSSGVSNFKSARLHILDDNNIEITTYNPLQQKFIEAERAGLIDHLQRYFSNRFLTYRVSLSAHQPDDSEKEIPLTTREKYLRSSKNTRW